MKNDDEMYQSVLFRREEYLKKKEKRILTIWRTVPVIACFCFTVVFIPMLWNNLEKFPSVPIHTDSVDESTIENAADTTESSSKNQPINTNAISTTISAKKTKTDIVTATKKNQTQTDAVSDQGAGKETEHETQTLVTDVPVVIETQTTAPIQAAVETSVTTVDFSDSDLLIGYDKGNHIGENILPSPLHPKRIVMRCKSFCEPGQKLLVDAAMADGTLIPANYDAVKRYEYSIYSSEGFINGFTNNKVEDENIIINGEQGEYKKEYSGEEVKLFDINGEYDDYDSYHHETAVIDFSGYKADSSGCITFSYSVVYDEDTLESSGSEQRLYFYVGEKGAAVSNISIEKAKEGYQIACNLPERS